jgi:Zn-dependent M28 family amino/carboxypeptidase
MSGPRIPNGVNIVDVLAIKPGKMGWDHVIIIAGHIDSRVSDVMDFTKDAPGANDDGSGSALVIEAARIMAQQPQTEATIVFALLSGEEQGLMGGRLLAETAKERGWKVSAMLNNDIVGGTVGTDGRKVDTVVRNVRWLALLGDHAYDFAIWLNGHIARVRRHLGLPYWSFSQWSKDKVKRAVSFVTAFEEAVVRDARHHKVDIVVCGHIHKATIKQFDDVTYVNSGDWVESCTAILEHHDGALEICNWHKTRDQKLGQLGVASREPVAA